MSTITSETITPYAGFRGQLSILETPQTHPARYSVYAELETNPGTRTLVYQTNLEHDAIGACLKTIEYALARNPYEIPMLARETPRLFVQDATRWCADQIFHATYGTDYRARGDIMVSSRLRETIKTMARENDIARVLSKHWDIDAQDARAMLPTPTPLIGNYIAYDVDKSAITYLPATKPLRTYDGFNTAGRVNAKPVRAFKTLYPDLLAQFNDHDFERFNDLFMARINPMASFTIVRGEDIRSHYDEESYADDLGWSSCMSYSYCYDYLEMYAANPDKIGLLVSLDNDDMVTGRALVWTQDDGTMYLDRIYANDARHEQQFRDYMAQTYGDAYTRYAGVVSLTSYDFAEYPYMDTFRYLDMDNGALSSGGTGGHYRILQSTDGSFEEWGNERTYAVTMTRTVELTTVVYVMAASEYDAMETANHEHGVMTINYPDMYTEDTGDVVMIDDVRGELWCARTADHDPDFD